MAILDILLSGAREIAARSLELDARQEDAGDDNLSTLTGTVSPTMTVPTSTASIDPDDSGFRDNRDRDQNTTSPLLFFVALGFGVVFTNLWIIVGVKYCFRYNARNRQMRMAEEGDPVALENMPRPHRRRREKKLMTMDEVNEKFPMMKYKNWVSARAQEGLPTMGGVSAPPSRANSVRSVEGVAPELPSKERTSDGQRPTTSASMRNKADEAATGGTTNDATKNAEFGKTDTRTTTEGGQTSGATAEGERSNLQQVESDDENDDEHINPALPPECMGTSGDACAICIESLEDDDDVRGLTCGHAFHAVCLDPWLTSRRACCPLCKADYYTPKPRPQATDANGNPQDPTTTFGDMGRTNSRLNLPSTPQNAWYNFRGRGRRFLPAGLRPEAAPQQTQRTRDRRRPAPAATRPPAQSTANTTPETTESRSGNVFTNFRPSLPRVRLPQLPQLRRNNQAQSETPVASGANDAVTPSQLEAGNRPAASS